MRIIAVDDEELALGHLIRIIEKAQPGCEVAAFKNPYTALEFIKDNEADIAFLDVEMYGINGIELAKALKDIQPQINIIFVTGFPEYAVEAFTLHASGYLLKPASVEGVINEITNLRNSFMKYRRKEMFVHTFGNFEIFYCNKPLEFGRGKSKELLAYLIDRKGAGCTTAELCGILFEDKEYNISLQKQFQTIVSDLIKTLKKDNLEEVLVKKRNFLSVDISKIDCDYYRFLNGDVSAINSYMGEYMTNYSWAEFTAGYLYQSIQNK